MSKWTKYYQAFIERFTRDLQTGEHQINKAVETTEAYLNATSDLTRDELALINAYIERDLAEFAQSYEESKAAFKDGVFYLSLKESIWQGLAEITDKTQLEWREVIDDVTHHGVYQSGEIVGLGNLVCEHCHHRLVFNHPDVLPVCPKCGGTEFNRQPFQP